MTLREKLKADIAHSTNAINSKSVIKLFFAKKSIRIVVLFRILNHYYFKKNKVAMLLLSPVALYYRLMTNKYCVDLSYKTKIGPGLKMNHCYCTIVNIRATIGEHVYIAHNVTIGSNTPAKVPTIGNNVTIFPGSIIIGDVTIGDNCIIGANNLIYKSVPANTIVKARSMEIMSPVYTNDERTGSSNHPDL